MYVVIVTNFVGRVMQSLLINDFILYAAVVKCIVLIAVYTPCKFPL